MKSFFLILLVCSFSHVFSQSNDSTRVKPDPSKPLQVVEASCGQCKFGLTGKGCDLAVRIKDKAYFVDGTKIDDHGDAHAQDGFCQSIRKAEVQGDLVNNRYKVTYFKLLPSDPPKQ